MKKYLANGITMVRIVLAPVLFFFHSITDAFIVIYLICAVSDFLDGPVARITHSSSHMGALLDTIGDFLMYGSMMKVMIASGAVPLWTILWLAGALLIHLAAAFICWHRFGRFYLNHALSSKLMGAAFFITPFSVRFGVDLFHLTITCIISSISAVEAVMIQLKANSAGTDILSLIGMLKRNPACKPNSQSGKQALEAAE